MHGRVIVPLEEDLVARGNGGITPKDDQDVSRQYHAKELEDVDQKPTTLERLMLQAYRLYRHQMLNSTQNPPTAIFGASFNIVATAGRDTKLFLSPVRDPCDALAA